MTRKEETVLAAKAAEKSTGFGELVHSKESRGVNSAYGIGFLEGSAWSDAHPVHYDGQAMLYVLHKGVVQGKKETLDKACKCLKANFVELYLHYMRGASVDEIVDEFREDLKKSMEE